MRTFDYKNHKVTIFTGYNGIQLFVSNSQGVQIYAHRVSSNPVARAEEIINQQ